jgi:hypothetical protein
MLLLSKPKKDLKWALLRINYYRALRAHACNPSYSGGTDQEDCDLKPARANSSRDPILKNPSQKYGWWNGSRWIPWVQASVLQKQKQKQKNLFTTSNYRKVPSVLPQDKASRPVFNTTLYILSPNGHPSLYH